MVLMVQVRISETYDLSTKVNKMGLVGIHTPTGNLIDRLWPGLVLQHKKFRIAKCDVAMACASMLPADPLQIGVEAGSIAPQDMFNPILYKAVSNDSMSNILGVIANLGQNYTGELGLSEGSINSFNDLEFHGAGSGGAALSQSDIYYGLLSDTSGWRKAMPQAGLTMRNLVPLVYEELNVYGNSDVSDDDNSYQVPGVAYEQGQPPDAKDGTINAIVNHRFRGRSVRMPWISTTYYSETGSGIVPGASPLPTAFVSSNTGKIPPVYVACLVLPPAVLNVLYYRLKITWTIEFADLRSMADISSWNNLAGIGLLGYGTDYTSQSASMTSLTSMVDANGADVKKVMEGST